MGNWKFYNPQFSFEKHLQRQDSAWIGHINFGYDLVRNIKPKIIVELGTHRGHSFFSFAQAVKDGGLKTRLYAIDSWEGDSHAGFYGEKIYKEVKKVAEDEYPKVDITLLRGYFQDFVKDFKNNTIDILHIDGLHTYKAVKSDFEMWLPKMKKTGIVLIHDISEKKKGFGVYKLWEELETKYNAMSMEYSHGLGVIFFDNLGYEQFKSLENNLQNYYSKCSQIITQGIEISEENKLIKDISQIKDELLKENSNKDLRIEELNHKITKIENSRIWKLRNNIAKLIGKEKV